MTQEIQIPSQYVHPGELAAFPANSNTHSPQNIEELAESRRQFSQYKNVVTWMTDKEMTVTLSDGSQATLKPGIKYVIAGEGFWKASIKRRDSDIEIKNFSHLTYEEALLLAEADNASPLGSKIDPAQIRANLDRARNLYKDNPRLAAMLDRAREQAGAVEVKSNKEEVYSSEFLILIEFENEHAQANALEKFTEEGYICRSLIS